MIVVFVGIDGCGKSTVGQQTADSLKALGRDALYLEDPGGTPIGDRIRRILLEGQGDRAAMTETLLFFASRCELWDHIVRPAVQAGKDIVLARWWFCTAAYQGAVGISSDFVKTLADAVCPLPLDHRLCFWLDVSVDTARARIQERDPGKTADRFEAQDRARWQAVRAGYARLANEGLLVRIDAERPLHQVIDDVWTRIEAVRREKS